MTKEDAKDYIREWCPYDKQDEIIKALEQEPILDKIRAEIEGLTYYWCEVNPKTVIFDDVLRIIDNYKAESEDKE